MTEISERISSEVRTSSLSSAMKKMRYELPSANVVPIVGPEPFFAWVVALPLSLEYGPEIESSVNHQGDETLFDDLADQANRFLDRPYGGDEVLRQASHESINLLHEFANAIKC